MTKSSSGLEFRLQNDILHLQLSRPDSGNSFGTAEAKALLTGVKTYKTKARAVIWTSAGSSLFCAGGDLKQHVKLKDRSQGLREIREIRKALDEFAHWPIPKAVHVNGDCFGGGLELLSCFDYRVAAAFVFFGFWQRRVALTFGWGGFARWSEKLSPEIVKSLGQPARVFGASEALRLRIVQEVGAYEQTKKWIAQTLKWDSESGVTLARLTVGGERKEIERLWWNPDHRRVLKKF